MRRELSRGLESFVEFSERKDIEKEVNRQKGYRQIELQMRKNKAGKRRILFYVLNETDGWVKEG